MKHLINNKENDNQQERVYGEILLEINGQDYADSWESEHIGEVESL